VEEPEPVAEEPVKVVEEIEIDGKTFKVTKVVSSEPEP